MYILIFFLLMKVYESVTDAKNTKSSSNFALCYTNTSGKVEFGMAIRFLKIDKHVYSIVKTENKKRPFTCDMELQDSIDIFFLIGQMSDDLKIIKIEQIINKACFLNNIECNEIFFSKCTELQEHD